MTERLSTGDMVLAEKVERALSPLDRMRGLLGRPRLRPGEALMIEPASQVHTIGMRYAIDVVFCDRDLVVQRVVRDLPPWRITAWVRRARAAFEFAAGTVPDSVMAGDRLRLSAVSRRAP